MKCFGEIFSGRLFEPSQTPEPSSDRSEKRVQFCVNSLCLKVDNLIEQPFRRLSLRQLSSQLPEKAAQKNRKLKHSNS